MGFLGKPQSMRKKINTSMNITSMMDMFTIILVFLLFSYSIDDQDLSIEPDLRLPDSVSSTPYRDAISVSLTKNAIKVNSGVVLKLRNGQVPKSQKEGLKILPLYDALIKEKEVLEKKPVEDKAVTDTLVLFQADRKVPFSQIDPVMKTAGMAGFPNFRFAVMRVD